MKFQLQLDAMYYRAEGNNSIVLSQNEHSLKIRKERKQLDLEIPPNDRFLSNLFLPRHIIEMENVPICVAELKAIEARIENMRPRFRRTKSITFRQSLIVRMPDLTKLPQPLRRVTTGSTLCVELKIKPNLQRLADCSARMQNNECCLFCAKQLTQAKLDRWSQTTRYCPCDMLSSNSQAMRAALLALFNCPQNNLTVWADGVRVLSGVEKSADEEEPCDAQHFQETADFSPPLLNGVRNDGAFGGGGGGSQSESSASCRSGFARVLREFFEDDMMSESLGQSQLIQLVQSALLHRYPASPLSSPVWYSASSDQNKPATFVEQFRPFCKASAASSSLTSSPPDSANSANDQPVEPQRCPSLIGQLIESQSLLPASQLEAQHLEAQLDAALRFLACFVLPISLANHTRVTQIARCNCDAVIGCCNDAGKSSFAPDNEHVIAQKWFKLLRHKNECNADWSAALRHFYSQSEASSRCSRSSCQFLSFSASSSTFSACSCCCCTRLDELATRFSQLERFISIHTARDCSVMICFRKLSSEKNGEMLEHVDSVISLQTTRAASSSSSSSSFSSCCATPPTNLPKHSQKTQQHYLFNACIIDIEAKPLSKVPRFIQLLRRQQQQEQQSPKQKRDNLEHTHEQPHANAAETADSTHCVRVMR